MTETGKEYEIVSKRTINSMAVMISSIVILLSYTIIIFLSQMGKDGVDGIILYPSNKFIALNNEAKTLILVACTGMLGSIIHLISSFVKYVGVKRFEKSWVIWYILRPFVGMGIAIIFYFTLRGGFLSGSTSADSINIYGVLTISGLAGMFSKQATEKLNELFNNLFKTDQDEDEQENIGKVDGPSPVSEETPE